jgi:hypothetical protein
MRYLVELKAVATVIQAYTLDADSSEEARSKALSSVPYHKWKFDGIKDMEKIEVKASEVIDE